MSDRPLADQVVVFTGKLSSLGRKEAQALVIRLGGSATDELTAKTTMVVVGDEGVSTSEKSQKLKKAEELGLRIVTENDFCRIAGIQPPEDLKQQYYSQRDLLSMYGKPITSGPHTPATGLREDHLRYLEKWGLIRPVMRTRTEIYYSFADLLMIRRVSAELEGAPFRAIVRALQAERSGQLTFDFRIDAEPARIIKLTRLRQRETGKTLAEEYFMKASALDADEARHGAAATWYRKALEIDPYLVPALINLANIHYGRDELAEAQALYERAIGLDPDFFEAHFNLGNIYHDLGRFLEAGQCYRKALRLNPQYADAHFYLAITLEKTGHSPEAKPHWRAYQELSPDGEWVELAREFSE
jgi:tetratricopeptide (TPR) repeat protein